MEWYVIVIIIAGIFIILYLSFIMTVFRTLFKAGVNPPINQVDLTKTHYAPYIDIVHENMDYMYKQEYTEDYVENEGLKLYGRYFNNNSDKTIVMVHGYRAVPYSNFSTQARYFLNHGYNVFFVYQRAHEVSDGRYITFGYKEADDVLKWCEYLYEKYHHDLILYGTSMGSATVINAASKTDKKYITGVIADCGFDRCYKQLFNTLKNNHYPARITMPVVNMFARIHGFSLRKNNPIEAVKNIHIPIVLVHSKLDTTIPYTDSEKIYNLASSPKYFLLSEKGGHTTGFLSSDESEKEKMLDFIKKYM